MRRDLLPLWIKIFLWFFIFTGIGVVIAFIIGFWDIYIPLQLYGLRAELMDTPRGLLLLAIFLLKGVVSYMLWNNWIKAIDFALVDAVIGVIISSYVTLSSLSNTYINFRIEILILLI